MEKSADAFRTISEVADDLDLPQHVLRFWETRFPQIRPLKRAGGRRYYRPADVRLLRTIQVLLYDEGYTIKGVQRLLKEQGPRAVEAALNGAGPATVDATLAPAEAPGGFVGDGPDAEPASNDELLAPPHCFAAGGTETLPGASGGVLDSAALRSALSLLEECERILKALRR